MSKPRCCGKRLKQREAITMDVDSYIARYTGETRLKRLLSIAVAGSQIDLSQRQRALKLAEQQMRRDGNALLYKEVFGESEEGIRRKIATHDPNLFGGKKTTRSYSYCQYFCFQIPYNHNSHALNFGLPIDLFLCNIRYSKSKTLHSMRSGRTRLRVRTTKTVAFSREGYRPHNLVCTRTRFGPPILPLQSTTSGPDVTTTKASPKR